MSVSFDELQIITVSYNHSSYLNTYFQSFLDVYGSIPAPIYITDNNSSDDSKEILAHWQKYHPEKIFVHYHDINMGFSKANNLLANKSQSKYLLFLNPDISFNQDFISPCIDFIKNKNTCASPALIDHQSKQIYDNFDSFYDSWFYTLHKILSKLISPKYNKVDWIQGACLFLHRKHFQKCQGFNEQYFVFTEDMHLGKELKKLKIQSYIINNIKVFHPYRKLSKDQLNYMCKNLSLYHKEYPIYPFLFHQFLLQIFKPHQSYLKQLYKALQNEQ